MKERIKYSVIFLCAIFGLSGYCASTFAEQKPPTGDELAALATIANDSVPEDYASWVMTIEDQYPAASKSLAAVQAGEQPDDEQIVWLGRMLGVWNRIQNESNALKLLAQIIAIPTFASSDYPDQYDNPEFIQLGELIKTIASDFGLAYRNVDGRIFEVTLKGTSDDAFGVLTHSDVVPVEATNWVLEDGTKLDPFKMQIIGNNIYGRGTIDDKGSIITALYAMKAIKESGLPVKRDIRLMVETTEETSGAGMEYYMEHNNVPDYNIVLDSDYPAVTAEKGYGTINAYFPVSGVEGDVVITAMTAGTATNQIPGTSTATLTTNDIDGLVSKIENMATDYTQGPNGDFEITSEEIDGDLV